MRRPWPPTGPRAPAPAAALAPPSPTREHSPVRPCVPAAAPGTIRRAVARRHRIIPARPRPLPSAAWPALPPFPICGGVYAPLRLPPPLIVTTPLLPYRYPHIMALGPPQAPGTPTGTFQAAPPPRAVACPPCRYVGPSRPARPPTYWLTAPRAPRAWCGRARPVRRRPPRLPPHPPPHCRAYPRPRAARPPRPLPPPPHAVATRARGRIRPRRSPSPPRCPARRYAPHVIFTAPPCAKYRHPGAFGTLACPPTCYCATDGHVVVTLADASGYRPLSDRPRRPSSPSRCPARRYARPVSTVTRAPHALASASVIGCAVRHRTHPAAPPQAA